MSNIFPPFSVNTPPPQQPMITDIPNVPAFAQLLTTNQGLIILKFGAEWCGPCKKIAPLVDDWFSKINTNPTIQCGIIDIDDNIELYGFLKTKKRVNGVPVIMCFDKGNTSYISNDIVMGSNPQEVNAFFMRCMQRLKLANLPGGGDNMIVNK